MITSVSGVATTPREGLDWGCQGSAQGNMLQSLLWGVGLRVVPLLVTYMTYTNRRYRPQDRNGAICLFFVCACLLALELNWSHLTRAVALELGFSRVRVAVELS